MNKLIDGLKSIISLIWQDIINLYHLFDSYLSENKTILNYASKLGKNGIIIIPDFISREECDKIYEQAKTFLSNYSQTTRLNNGTYIDFRSIDDKGGPDRGMIDVSNIDKSIEDIHSLNISVLDEIMLNVSSMDLYLSQINLYYNKNVKGTRIYHVDNCQPVVYKGFIYLTDVKDNSNGPYSFIQGTQRFSFLVYFNLFMNIFKRKYRITDMPITSNRKRVDAIGNKGTLVLSNQNGIHRGLPQGEGKERMAIIYNYLVISRLNYKHQTIKKVLLFAKKIFRRN